MDFELTKAQKDIQKAARAFAKGEFEKGLALELEAKHEFPRAIWQKAGELGFLGVHFPEEYGGAGYGSLENALIVEAFCQADSSIGSALMASYFSSQNITLYGTPEQKERYLPPLAEGEAILGGAYTEPEHGSDIRQMSTTAVKDGDAWVLNGAKTFITNGGTASTFVTLAQTDPDAAHKGQTMFLVPADVEGLEISDAGQKMGMRLSPTGELVFKNVRLPAEQLLGKEGRGFYQALHFFDESRVEVAAQALGIGQGAFDRALAYTKGRVQFGKKIAAFQVNQHKLADMATQLELARLITYKAAWNLDQGRTDPKLTSMAKFFAARTAVEVSDEAIQLMGGYGYMAEFDVERCYRDAKVTEIYEGTREIQKNTIASAVIGKL